MPHHIFLSYSRKDSEIMQRVKGDFEAAGLTMWTDEGIEPGTRSWKKAIEEAIIEAECLICVLSPDAKASPWVQAELDHAELHGKPIFLILARGDERSSIPFGFAAFQWVDIRADGQYAAGVTRLVGTVQKRLGIEERETLASPLQPPDVSGILPPPFEWCEVPAGKATVSYRDYRGDPTFYIERFWMAKYPVTNAQFQVFVDAEDGYKAAHWWSYSDAAREWRKENSIVPIPIYIEPDVPRTYVSWYESVAFCKWLSWKTKLVGLFPEKSQEMHIGTLSLRLPKEQEWQRAAQGDDRRNYPWGAMFDLNRVNIYSSGISKPTSVTLYPHGASPFGILGMSGNIWEMTISEWGGEQSIDKQIVVRGGSFGSASQEVTTMYRAPQLKDERNNASGFRIMINAQGEA